MSLTQISIDADTLARLDATAAANSASREEALKEAIDTYCAYDRWFKEVVEEGRKAFREGRCVSNEEAVRLALERDAELRGMLPGTK
ncbi:MAG: ribbon-helix-helix protein, CopG family [Desulfovibrio sp.]|nr:ribbon-helix-helix protein, CopG family [Desulfovibrio sp.]